MTNHDRRSSQRHDLTAASDVVATLTLSPPKINIFSFGFLFFFRMILQDPLTLITLRRTSSEQKASADNNQLALLNRKEDQRGENLN